MVNLENRKPVVLIGGFGFVGRNILERMAGADYGRFRPLVIDNLSNACPGFENLGVTHATASYDGPEVKGFLDAEASGNRTFVFLAGETRVAESRERPLDFVQANIVQPSAFVVEHVRPGDKFVLVSTAGALYDGSFPITAESAFCPKNFYGATKAAEELILEKLVEMQGAHYAVVRMTNVFGRHSVMKKSAIHAFARALLSGTEVTVNGDGNQTRDFIYAGDVARGILSVVEALDEGAASRINLLGAGRSVSLNDVMQILQDVSCMELKYKRVAAKELLASEPRDVTVVPEEVQKILGDGITSLEDGIRETFEYYKTILR